jgi:hypothetical protein
MGYCLVRPGASQYGGPLAVLAGSLPEAAPTPDKTPLGVAVWHARFKAELAKQLVEASQ